MGKIKKNRDQIYDANLETEDLYNEIMERAHDAIFYLSSEGTLITLSMAFENITGWKISDWIGKSFLGLVHPDDISVANERLVSSSKGNPLPSAEIRILKRSGGYVCVEILSSPLLKNGRTVGILGIARDITEQKLVMNALQESETNFHVLFDENPFPTILSEMPYGRITFANKCMAAKLNMNVTDIIGKTAFDLGLLKNINDQKKLTSLISIQGYVDNVEIEKTLPGNIQGADLIFMRLVIINGKQYCLTVVQDITNQKLAEEKIRNSEERLKILFDYAPDAYFLTDIKGTFVDGNLAAEKLLGQKKDEIIGKNILESGMLSHNQTIIAAELMAKSALGLPTGPDEFVLTRSDKSKVAVEIITYPIKIQNQTLVLGLARDVTERKLAEEALRENEEKYRLISTLTSDYIFRLNVDENGLAKIDMLSDNYSSITNRFLENVSTPDLWAKFIHPDDLGKILEILQSLISKGGDEEIECRSLMDDGSLRWVQVMAHAIMDKEHSRTKTIVGAVKDITRRKQVEETLTSERTLLRTLVDLLPAIVFIKDRESRFLVANNACALFMGASSYHELIGKTDAEFYPPDLAKEYRVDELNVLKGIPIVNKEETSISHNGTWQIRLTTKMPFRDTNGNIVGLVGASIDISDRKKAEEAIIRAKEKAEESDRLKSAFLANMSHEIRTPMNGILGFADLLKSKLLTSEERHEYIDVIEKSGERMLKILNDIIDLSKIESGQMTISVSEFNINEHLEFVYTFFKPEANIKGINLYFINDLPSDEAVIKTDKEKINAILTNLIKNAVKFTNEGSIKFGYEKKGQYLQFFVKDTGEGIPSELREIIFERFRQGSESLARNYEGAGLGLSISKSYVEMLGGKIWVESEQGRGSSFYFTVPWVSEISDKRLLNIDSLTDVRNKYRKLLILIAEDDSVSELLISNIVKDFSREILKAKNGAEAVEICRNNRDIDLVLMDIKMPEMDGYEAASCIRQFNKKVVIIAQTAYAQLGDKDKAANAGCNDYISKPIMKKELLSLINKHFSPLRNNI